MTPQKRLLDLVVIVALLPLLIPLGLVFAALILWRDGAPVLFLQERMKTPRIGFDLVKFRTMRADPADAGVSGGDKSARITASGRLMRRFHIDEVPQALNVLRGDISLVGPRPPLKVYVDRFPELYAQVLQSRPGLTGLASVYFARHEAWLLAQCDSAEETDAVYSRRCVPRKARIDLIYQRRQSLKLDLWLMVMTILKTAGVDTGRWGRGRRT